MWQHRFNESPFPRATLALRSPSCSTSPPSRSAFVPLLTTVATPPATLSSRLMLDADAVDAVAGPFNSWDRVPYIGQAVVSGGEPTLYQDWHEVRRLLVRVREISVLATTRERC